MPWEKQYRTKPLKDYNLKNYRQQGMTLYQGTDLCNVIDPESCCKRKDQRYTGSTIIGISTMHKSNSVPIFSAEEAETHAKMRRN